MYIRDAIDQSCSSTDKVNLFSDTSMVTGWKCRPSDYTPQLLDQNLHFSIYPDLEAYKHIQVWEPYLGCFH